MRKPWVTARAWEALPGAVQAAMGACEDCRFISHGLVILCTSHAPLAANRDS
jgi:hypothetical protein